MSPSQRNRLIPSAVHVISNGVDAEGWTPVPEETSAMVDLTSLELRRLAGWKSSA